ncbi:MAG: ATP-binding protein [Nitrospirota bacterium]
MNPKEEKIFFENLLESIVVVDREGKIKELNSVTLKLLGYGREDLIMQPMEKICMDFSLKNLKDKIPLREKELMYLSKWGENIPVSANIIGRLSHPDDIIFMARDIRITKRLINELTRSKEELENSYTQIKESKDELVRSEKLAFTGRIAAGIAHEIRNPLTNVLMSVQQIKKGFGPESPWAKHIEVITRNTERINYLITELLNCARPPKLNMQSYDMHRLLEGVLESVQHDVKSQGIKVVKNFTPESPIISMDNEQMERAFSNIILNAVQAMPRGGNLTVVTEVDGNFFEVKIEDTGEGIPEEDIIRIFDPFFSSKPSGVGLGLTICYGIIVSHGGTTEVESKPGEGTVFTIALPLGGRE